MKSLLLDGLATRKHVLWFYWVDVDMVKNGPYIELKQRRAQILQEYVLFQSIFFL